VNGPIRIHPADLAAIADAVSTSLYLDGDLITRAVHRTDALASQRGSG